MTRIEDTFKSIDSGKILPTVIYMSEKEYELLIEWLQENEVNET